jgi:hypothetical protein
MGTIEDNKAIINEPFEQSGKAGAKLAPQHTAYLTHP